MLGLPSGRKIELMRRGGTNAFQIYEAQDGSLLRLTVASSARYLYFPNGTRLTFGSAGQCLEIRDRNGNLITATYDPNYGYLTKITDTLGREVTFEYNPYFDLADIKQTRRDENNIPVTVTLAHFGYADITLNTNFSVTSDTANGTIIPVLSTVQLASGSVYKFDYTTYAQVKTIHHYGPLSATANPNNLSTEYRELSTTSYNLPTTTAVVQTDCPRFTTRTDYAADWASGVTTTYNRSGNYGEVTTPDGTKVKEYYNLATTNAESWLDGLVFKTELSDNTPTIKRTTLTTWEQVGGTVWGPRVADATVTDNENGSARFSSFVYGSYNLPLESYSFKGANASGTMLQKTTTSYLLTSAYVSPTAPTAGSKWLVGLPAESNSYAPNDPSGTTFTNLSRVTYQYDQTPLTAQLPAGGSLSNHDTANFGTGFTARGNVSHVTKWDTVNTASAITTTTKYNTTGLPIEQSLPDNNLTNRKTLISYDDAFSDATAINNTFAYPTTVTDPEGQTAKLKYRYDIGAVTRTQDPKMMAADATKGIVSTYDAVGRIRRTDNEFSTAYTRYTYDTSFYWANTFTKADDAGNELYGAAIFDGHGRVRANLSSHPGSVGGLRSQFSVYDVMGRVIQSSNPTEINGGWGPTGDDAAGYVWSQQTYDWKGRPKITTNQDGSTKQYEYGGCGCTGEATVTVTDEVGRKTRRISDAFLDNAMQVDKTEVLNMFSTTVYSTMATVTKPLERKSYVLQAAGELTDYSACPAGNCNSATKQQTTTTFSGLGRVTQKQAPQQSGATAYSAYTYYADGSIQTSTDARGAVGTLQYNGRGLPTSMNYIVPSGVEVTPNVSYTYDSNGNRLTMTDGMGTANYTYDTLSRLTSRSRTLTGLTGSFAINYEYYQSTGQLKKITDPFSDSISYAYDLTGRTTAVTGSAFGGVTSYVSGVTFRAGNQTKSLTSGTTTASMGYDSRMRVNNFQSGSINANYGYYGDSRLYQVVNPGNHLLDRYFDYSDPLGSMTYTSANGDTTANQYYLTMSHDYLGNQTSRGGRYWWMATGTTFSSSTQYLNNKIASGSDSGSVVTNYDGEGNLLSTTQGTTQTMGPEKYDAAGRVVAEINPTITSFYDGDGNLVKGDGNYYLHSKVLGGKQLSIISPTGTKVETSVFGNGQLLAKQEIVAGTGQVTFVHRDPHNTIDYTTSGEIKWVDVQGTTGKAATSTYISQYQAGVYGHPDPSFYAASSGQFYPGGGGNQKPGQSTVCTENYVKVDCNSLKMDERNGGIVHETVSSQSLTGYDDDSNSLLSGYNSIASTRNGQSTGLRGLKAVTKWRDRSVDPGDVRAGGPMEGGETIAEEYLELVEENLPGDHSVNIDHLESDNYGGKKGVSSERAVRVWKILNSFVNNPECINAYSALGVDIVAKLSTGFIRVGTHEYISENSDKSIESRLGVTNAGIVRDAQKNGGGVAFTLAKPGQFVNGQVTPTIFIRSGLFSAKGLALAINLAHELIHVGGVEGKPSNASTLRQAFGGPEPGRANDLDYLDAQKYKNVIEKCSGSVPNE